MKVGGNCMQNFACVWVHEILWGYVWGIQKLFCVRFFFEDNYISDERIKIAFFPAKVE